MAVEPHPPKTPPTDNIDFHIVKKLQIRGSDYHHIVQNIINQHICWGELCFDILRKNAHWRDDMLEICPREFDLLLFLAQYEGRIVAKDHIRNRVWELGFDPGTNIVEVHICRLRSELGKLHDAPIISTVRNRGYRLDIP